MGHRLRNIGPRRRVLAVITLAFLAAAGISSWFLLASNAGAQKDPAAILEQIDSEELARAGFTLQPVSDDFLPAVSAADAVEAVKPLPGTTVVDTVLARASGGGRFSGTPVWVVIFDPGDFHPPHHTAEVEIMLAFVDPQTGEYILTVVK